MDSDNFRFTNYDLWSRILLRVQRDRREVRQKRSASTPLFSNSLIYSKFAFSTLSISEMEVAERRKRESAKGKSENTLRFAPSYTERGSS